jgi:hypothetical protein
VAPVRLENIVWDAREPHRLAVLGHRPRAEPITDGPALVEARLHLGSEVFLDLCFQRVAEPSTAPARLHPDLAGGEGQQEVVERLLDLGAEHVDIGRGAVPWVVLADPEGNAFCVLEDPDVHRGTGPIARCRSTAQTARDAAFWAGITGWVPWPGASRGGGAAPPVGGGAVAAVLARARAQARKNRLHLDVRPDAGDDDVALALGGEPPRSPAVRPPLARVRRSLRQRVLHPGPAGQTPPRRARHTAR